MSLNQQIKRYLTNHRNEVLKQFSTNNQEFKLCFEELVKIDIDQLKAEFFNQLTVSSSQNWPKEGDYLDAIYLEIMDTDYPTVSADAYGISSGTLEFQVEPYQLENVEIHDDFNRYDGVTHEKNPIAPMYKVPEFWEFEECKELETGYYLTFCLALHKAFNEFVGTEPFLSLKRNSPFQVLIAIHDRRQVQPLWIIE